MLKPIRLVMLCLVAAIGVACVEKPMPETTVEYLDSGLVTKKIKAKLMDQLGTAGFAIKVKTYRDEVQLSGVVDNVATQQKAGAIAAGIEHVKHVRNDVMVK